MPDVAMELIASVSYTVERFSDISKQSSQLEEEFRYLQRKKNVVKELAESRQKVRIRFFRALVAG